MSQYYVLEFEKPVTELEKQIEALDAELAATPPEAQAAIVRRIDDLRSAHQQTLKAVYSNLTAWETVRVARHLCALVAFREGERGRHARADQGDDDAQ